MSNLDEVFDESAESKLDPMEVFAAWFAVARAHQTKNPDAVCLATAGADGAPSARMVLLKGFGNSGFVFYTNTESRKGEQLAANPRAALCFYWRSLDRQVRIEGTVIKVADGEADEYFATRPKGAQLGAWVSDQSRPLARRSDLEARLEEVGTRFRTGPIPRPAHWSGYCLRPTSIEFWRSRNDRLHDRMRFTRTDGTWHAERLYP